MALHLNSHSGYLTGCCELFLLPYSYTIDVTPVCKMSSVITD